jgi:hypothetical protein
MPPKVYYVQDKRSISKKVHTIAALIAVKLNRIKPLKGSTTGWIFA